MATIKIGDHEYKIDEARRLYDELKELFNKESDIDEWEKLKDIFDKERNHRPFYPNPYPIRPWSPVYPPWECPPIIYYTTTTTTSPNNTGGSK